MLAIYQTIRLRSISACWPVVREPARSPAAARDRYVRIIQQPLTCIATAIWYSGPALRGDADDLAIQLTGFPSPVRLKRDGRSALFLAATQQYRLVPDDRYGSGEWKASTRGYIYTVYEECDREPREALAWHWHPHIGPDQPHMHVYCGGCLGGVNLKDIHLPSERVAFEHVVKFLITELGVSPRRDDWIQLIDSALERFEAFRTWPRSGPHPN